MQRGRTWPAYGYARGVPDARTDTSAPRRPPGRPTRASPSCPYGIERCELVPLVRDTTSGFTKVSIVVRLDRRRPRGPGRGHHLGPDRSDRAAPPRGRPLVAARDAHLRRVLDAAGTGRPLPGRADPRERPLLPPVGVRERGARPRPAPERPLAAGRRRPRGAARQLRRVDADRRPAEPRPAPTLRRSRSRRCGSSSTRRPSWDDELVAELASLACVDVVDMKGSLPQRDRGDGAGPRPLPARVRGAARRLDRGSRGGRRHGGAARAPP